MADEAKTPNPAAPPATSPIGDAQRAMGGGQVPFGDVAGAGAQSPPMPDLDPREHALRTLALYVSLLNFRRTGDTTDGPTKPFRMPLDRIFVYQPDDVVNAPVMSGIGFMPSRGTHEPYGLGPPVVLDGTADVFAPGTVLVRKGDYTELIGVEVVEAKHPTRRAVVAGIKEALRAGDDSGALKLRCPSYYNRIAAFRLDESEYLDDADSALNRRRAHLYVQLQIQEVQLIAYRGMVPRVGVEVTAGE